MRTEFLLPRVAINALVIALAGLLAACSEAPTQIVVRITSDMTPVTELAAVQIIAQREGASQPFVTQRFALTDGAQGFQLPGEIGLVARDPSDLRAVHVTVLAEAGINSFPVDAVVHFQRGHINVLEIALPRRCGMPMNRLQCVMGNLTCGPIGCIPISHGELPDLVPDAGAPDVMGDRPMVVDGPQMDAGDSGACTIATVRACYSGPPATAGIGSCRAGMQICGAGGVWTPCQGEVGPQTEICGNSLDDNCSGAIDEACCPAGRTSCTGNCVDLLTDTNNCGRCGQPCPAGARCAAGVCRTPPANDQIASATPISLFSPTSALAANLASANHESTLCVTTGPDVFYTFTLARDEIVYADTLGSSSDTVLAFLDGAGAPLTDPGLPGGSTCSNDACGSVGSQIVALLRPGRYHLAVAARTVGSATPVSVSFQHLPAGGGAFVQLPSMGSMTYTGTTAGTGLVTGTCCSAGAEDTYWFVTCPAFAGATFSASTCGAGTIETGLDMRNAAATPVATCNDHGCGRGALLDAFVRGGPGLHTLYVDSCTTVGAYTLSIAFGTCAAGAMVCGGRCASLATDPMNCGACFTTCTAGQVCAGGLCGCPAGQVACSGRCVDLAVDLANCGACGAGCAAGTCMAGTCMCPAGQTLCAGACVDLTTSAMHCGACGATCSGTCVAGACMCPAGQTLCAGACVDLTTSAMHCGACGASCPGTCTAGACMCPAGQTLCAGACVDVTTSPMHCGMCGQTCLGGTCSASACTCPAGQSLCAGACVDLATSPMHCGMCGRGCMGGTCSASACSCPAGQTVCAGACTDTSSDDAHCATCGTACAVGTRCTLGVCI